jgi:hypothetical protein
MISHNYRQCLLQNTYTSDKTTSWIPSEKAVAGKTISLKEDDGTWSRGWRVVQVYHGERSSVDVADNERNYRSHRKATDI